MHERILSLSDFKADASRLLKRMADDDASALVLTQNGRASAVVQSYDDYHRLQDALAMLKLLALGETDVAAGKLRAHDEVAAAARARLAAALSAHD